MSPTKQGEAAAGFFSVIIASVQCWLSRHESLDQIPSPFSPRPRQDQVKMPRIPRRERDSREAVSRPRPISSATTRLVRVAQLQSARRIFSVSFIARNDVLPALAVAFFLFYFRKGPRSHSSGPVRTKQCLALSAATNATQFTCGRTLTQCRPMEGEKNNNSKKENPSLTDE